MENLHFGRVETLAEADPSLFLLLAEADLEHVPFAVENYGQKLRPTQNEMKAQIHGAWIQRCIVERHLLDFAII